MGRNGGKLAKYRVKLIGTFCDFRDFCGTLKMRRCGEAAFGFLELLKNSK